jgi:hypothetical protein
MCLSKNNPYSLIATADSATLKLDNQKNEWKGVCMHQEVNGEAIDCPVQALARRVIHLWGKCASGKMFLSGFYVDGKRWEVTGENISKGLKMAATLLQYPAMWGILIARINTHSLGSGGANALALSGYSDTQIQKMGHWKGITFKEYIREELACYSTGMSTSMKQNFKFVNISGNAYHDVTQNCMTNKYNINCAAAALHGDDEEHNLNDTRLPLRVYLVECDICVTVNQPDWSH